jgi:GTP-binding protein
LEVSEHLNTLYSFAHQKEFQAKDGIKGRNKNMHGANADPLIIPVPPGTLVLDAQTGELLADLTKKGEQFVAAKGGRGGRGNARFATSTNQAPRIAERGDPGEDRWLKLELKLLADVGLVGKPNAGKSTLISVTTAAKPEIAPYPFTTLQPNLGVVALDVNQTFVLADLPGLIAGASEGKGLGHEFLRHIERTRVIIHLLDGNALDPIADFQQINAELAAFGHGLMQKPQIVAVNKMDIPGVEEIFPAIKEEIEALGYEDVMLVSALTHQNTRELMGRAHQKLQQAPMPQIHRPMPAIIRPRPEELGYTITQEARARRPGRIDGAPHPHPSARRPDAPPQISGVPGHPQIAAQGRRPRRRYGPHRRFRVRVARGDCLSSTIGYSKQINCAPSRVSQTPQTCFVCPRSRRVWENGSQDQSDLKFPQS